MYLIARQTHSTHGSCTHMHGNNTRCTRTHGHTARSCHGKSTVPYFCPSDVEASCKSRIPSSFTSEIHTSSIHRQLLGMVTIAELKACLVVSEFPFERSLGLLSSLKFRWTNNSRRYMVVLGKRWCGFLSFFVFRVSFFLCFTNRWLRLGCIY